MSRLFSHNAYSVLGLETNASQKEVSKRSKEILNLLKIDERPDYETDLDSVNDIVRDESTVNDAVQRLSSPIKRIQEYFFWFETENDSDEETIRLLKDNQYDEAIDNWKKRSEKSLTSKKNLAVASSMLLNKTGYKKYLKLSVDSWSEIVASDKFWSHFKKVYALNDEVGTNEAALDEYRGKLTSILSDFYTEVSRTKKDNGIYAAFSAKFGVKGQKVQDEILTPIFDRINEASEQLQKLEASADNVLSSQESMTIKRLVKKIQDLFQEIKDLGLYDDSHSKVMRDKASKAINIVAVDLFNNLDEDKKASALIKIAKSIASGPAVISQINKNEQYIRKITSQARIIDPINTLIEDEKYSEALDLILNEQGKHKGDETLQTYLRKRTQWCVISIAIDDFKKAKNLLDQEDYPNAAAWLQGVHEFVYQYVSDFDVEKNSLDNVLDSLRSKLAYANYNSLTDIENYRQQVLDNSDDDIKSEDKLESTFVAMLMDTLIYQRVAEMIPEIKRQNNSARIKNLLWKVVIWGGIIGFIALSSSGGGDSDSDSSSSGSSSSSSAWQVCSDEYDRLKSELEDTESTMRSYQDSGYTDAYNNLVPEQNSLVQQVNDKAAECNNLR